MTLEHITPEQIAQYGVVASPDVLQGDPAASGGGAGQTEKAEPGGL